MSFILDALKKSELERQRQSVPGLMDSGSRAKRARFPPWAIALAALLAINLLVLVFVLARGGLPAISGGPAAVRRPPAAASPVGAAPAQVESAASTGVRPAAGAVSGASDSVPSRSHFSPIDAAVDAPEIPPENEPIRPPAAAGASATPRAAASGPLRARGRDPLLTEQDQSDHEALPSMAELNLGAADALPDLHIDVHVYATRAADRFVYINMRKYHEGNTLAEGPVLERIRRDGAVLDYHGLRFLLPRQQ